LAQEAASVSGEMTSQGIEQEKVQQLKLKKKLQKLKNQNQSLIQSVI
jgi:hypothetical protein